MMPLAIMTLMLLMAAPAFATPQPAGVYLERQHDADKAELKTPEKPAQNENCRVVKEWKVGETVVQHRICDDPPKKPVGKV